MLDFLLSLINRRQRELYKENRKLQLELYRANLEIQRLKNKITSEN